MRLLRLPLVPPGAHVLDKPVVGGQELLHTKDYSTDNTPYRNEPSSCIDDLTARASVF